MIVTRTIRTVKIDGKPGVEYRKNGEVIMVQETDCPIEVICGLLQSMAGEPVEQVNVGILSKV